jgi:isocitrate lyase
MLFRDLDAAKAAATRSTPTACCTRSTTSETHVVPIIADIDAGFGNAEATYLLAKKFIEAGACCIQIENQVSDEKQCGHQDGKVTVPHEDFLAKIRAVRYAFLELGVDDGIIVARTDSLGGPDQADRLRPRAGRLGDQYNSFLDCEEVDRQPRPRRRADHPRRQAAAPEAPAFEPLPVPSGNRRGPLRARCITSLQNGADLLWIETEKPHIGRSAAWSPHPRGDPQRQAGLQQLAQLQLDAELPPAGVRRLGSGRQGRFRL